MEAANTNKTDNWLKIADTAGKLKKKLIELNLNKNDRNDINSLFRSLCRFIIFFPLLTREESPKLFPYINYTIFQIIRRLVIRKESYKINKSLFYNIVIEILTYIFNVCEFNLDSGSIETLIDLKSSFNQIKFDLVKDEIYYWYHSEKRQKKRDTDLTIQQIINETPKIEAKILAKEEKEKELEASGEKKPPVFYSVSLHSEGQVTSAINLPKLKKKLEDEKTEFNANDNKYKTEIMELLDQSEHIKILIIPHPTCILTQAGAVIESPLTAEDYDNIFTIISKTQVTQACCDKYISAMLIKDKQIAYGSEVNILPPSEVNILPPSAANILPSEAKDCANKPSDCNVMGGSKGRKSRKLNNRKLNRTKRHRKKTKRYRSKKQRKTHKRR